MKQLDLLVYWITERETIRKLRRNSHRSKPWTEDPILQRYRFCNVRRMDDKVSQWLLNNWYYPNYGHKNALPACALARYINLPQTLVKIGFPLTWNPDSIRKRLKKLRKSGATIFNSAYMVRGDNYCPDKIDSVIDQYIQPLVDNPPTINTDSMERTWANIVPYYGWGSFMAGQVVADLVWIEPGDWKDRKTWAPMGPGSKRGINRLYGRYVNCKLNQKEFIEELGEVIAAVNSRVPTEITNRLDAIDYQNCLCEFDKYCRALDGGRPKRLYPGV